ncbi:hypothetical protein Tco_0970522 [Tanacetum coccineum]
MGWNKKKEGEGTCIAPSEKTIKVIEPKARVSFNPLADSLVTLASVDLCSIVQLPQSDHKKVSPRTLEVTFVATHPTITEYRGIVSRMRRNLKVESDTEARSKKGRRRTRKDANMTALMLLDKDLFESYGNAYSSMRDREDKDKDEDPPARSDQGSQPKSSGKSAQAEESIFEAADAEMP